MAVNREPLGPAPAKPAPWRDPRVRSIVYQALTLIVVVLLVAYFVHNTLTNLQRQGIASGFGFLDRTAGFDILHADRLHACRPTAGRSGSACSTRCWSRRSAIVLATILGFVIGLARLSTNWLVARLATVYIETVRNIPLLLQLLFWYFAVLQALPPRATACDRRTGLPQQPRLLHAAGRARGGLRLDRGRRCWSAGGASWSPGALGEAPARGDRAAVPDRLASCSGC